MNIEEGGIEYGCSNLQYNTRKISRKRENRDDDGKMKFSVILMLLSFVRGKEKNLKSFVCGKKKFFCWGCLLNFVTILMIYVIFKY